MQAKTSDKEIARTVEKLCALTQNKINETTVGEIAGIIKKCSFDLCPNIIEKYFNTLDSKKIWQHFDLAMQLEIKENKDQVLRGSTFAQFSLQYILRSEQVNLARILLSELKRYEEHCNDHKKRKSSDQEQENTRIIFAKLIFLKFITHIKNSSTMGYCIGIISSLVGPEKEVQLTLFNGIAIVNILYGALNVVLEHAVDHGSLHEHAKYFATLINKLCTSSEITDNISSYILETFVQNGTFLKDWSDLVSSMMKKKQTKMPLLLSREKPNYFNNQLAVDGISLVKLDEKFAVLLRYYQFILEKLEGFVRDLVKGMKSKKIPSKLHSTFPYGIAIFDTIDIHFLEGQVGILLSSKLLKTTKTRQGNNQPALLKQYIGSFNYLFNEYIVQLKKGLKLFSANESDKQNSSVSLSNTTVPQESKIAQRIRFFSVGTEREEEIDKARENEQALFRKLSEIHHKLTGFVTRVSKTSGKN